MSGKSASTARKRSSAAPAPTAAARGKAAPATLTSETIAADIAAFKKRGGRIDVLGNTPLRPHISPYRSRTDQPAANAPTVKPAGRKSAR